MHLEQHEVRIELGELLTSEFQIKSSIVDLSKASSIHLGAFTGLRAPFEQLVLSILRHLE